MRSGSIGGLNSPKLAGKFAVGPLIERSGYWAKAPPEYKDPVSKRDKMDLYAIFLFELFIGFHLHDIQGLGYNSKQLIAFGNFHWFGVKHVPSQPQSKI